jgi:hypothetical protein
MLREFRRLRLSVNEYSCTHGAQINLNFEDLTPYLTYGGRIQGVPKRKKRARRDTSIEGQQ